MELIFLLLSLPFVLTYDPCLPNNHLDQTDLHRSALFQPEPTDMELCDRHIQEGWHVFNGGNSTIPTHCVTEYHCGTKYPVWMKGTLPAVGVTASRQGCIAMTSGTSGSCCELTIDIKVKNCGHFYVYHLKPTHFCPMAYCAGETYTCNVGGSGGQCRDPFPKMTDFPVLGKPEVVQNSTVRFPCEVQYPLGQPGVGFEVTWTVDGHTLVDPSNGVIIVNHLTGDSRTVYLDYNMLKGNLGKTLKCRVRSYFTNTTNLKSDSFNSDGYFCGIKVLTERIVVDEKGPEKTVQVESTIPIPCNTAHVQDECKITFSVDTHTKDAMFSTCSYDIKLDPVTGKYLGSFKVTATKDFVSDGSQTHEVSFNPIVSFNHPVWSNYNVHPIHVTTQNSEHGHCNAHGDPHMIRMDYRGQTNVYVTGELTMYECKSSNKPLQVQVKTWPCGHYHPCICALVAREGNDAVQIDMCEKRKNQHAVPELTILSERGLDGTTVERDRSGKKFFINFPSGARVVASTYVLTPHGHNEKDGMMDVDIQAPPDNKGCGQGICGLWNDNPHDDLLGADGKHYSNHQVTEFANTWRVKPSESLFNQVLTYQPHYSVQHAYCTCSNGRVDCTKGSKNPHKRNCNGKCRSVRMSRLNRHHYRRYSDDDIDGEVPVDDVIIKKRQNFNYKPHDVFPTMTGISEDEARRICQTGLSKATLFNRCHDEPGMNLTALIDSCMEDVKASGSDLFLVTQLSTFDSLCQNEVMKKLSNYKTSPDGDLIPPLDVTDHVCPNQCSRRGECVLGLCSCHPGYTGVDCSINSNESPSIVQIRGDGLCDIRRRPCLQTNVIAENIMESANLTCRFDQESGNSEMLAAELVSAWEILCFVPVHGVSNGNTLQQYNISISLDGTTFSSPHTFTVYDSVCYQCDVTGSCHLKNDACLIGGHCYPSGYINTEHDKVCDPSRSQTEWSNTALDHYTALSSGCQCHHDPSSYNCACCRNGGCQCILHPNKCSECTIVGC